MTDKLFDKPPPGPGPSGAWWRYRIMWLVVGGPVVVVIAALITAVIAVRGADLIVDDSNSARSAGPDGAFAPAVKARNHAATPPSDR